MDECNGVSAVDNAWQALSKSSKFLCACIFPGVTVFGVCHKMSVFHSLIGLIVEDSTEHVCEVTSWCSLCGYEVGVMLGHGV